MIMLFSAALGLLDALSSSRRIVHRAWHTYAGIANTSDMYQQYLQYTQQLGPIRHVRYSAYCYVVVANTVFLLMLFCELCCARAAAAAVAAQASAAATSSLYDNTHCWLVLHTVGCSCSTAAQQHVVKGEISFYCDDTVCVVITQCAAARGGLASGHRPSFAGWHAVSTLFSLYSELSVCATESPALAISTGAAPHQDT